jgi:hypothetical protein
MPKEYNKHLSFAFSSFLFPYIFNQLWVLFDLHRFFRRLFRPPFLPTHHLKDYIDKQDSIRCQGYSFLSIRPVLPRHRQAALLCKGDQSIDFASRSTRFALLTNGFFLFFFSCHVSKE